MKRQKIFFAPPPVAVGTTPPAAATGETTDSTDYLRIALSEEENSGANRSIDLREWLDKGIDEWVWACAGQMKAFVDGKTVTPKTVECYWYVGMRWFFVFLFEAGGLCVPQALEPKHVRHFVGWLKEHEDWAYNTQKNSYATAKSVLSAMCRRGIVPAHPDLFPKNPFPGSNGRQKGQAPLPAGERIRVATALRDDLVAIHKEQFKGAERDALVVYLLSLAIRTGANTRPLLEARRDCLRPHPFMPTMMLLELFKRRGNATKLSALRFSREDRLSTSIPMDGVALLRKVLEFTEPLRAGAKHAHRDLVWLFRPSNYCGQPTDRVTVLGEVSMLKGITAFVERHNLRDDAGAPLRLNLSRLRKTLEHRLWDLSGGDLIAVAAVMGHAPKVADVHYLACTQKMREDATFVGEALPEIYRNGTGDAKVNPLHPDNTPVGRCKDPYNGEQAPKNGDPCGDFFSCFVCTSYAVVGSPGDLHRLFSFYWFLEREMLHARSNNWREQFWLTMNLIDRFTLDKFDQALVSTAKERARTDPLKFWASYTLHEMDNG